MALAVLNNICGSRVANTLDDHRGKCGRLFSYDVKFTQLKASIKWHL
uniref:Uncharacterized protein n=1 Tax=Anguilla anguilla TaxID=7936 RepID=A0A0E9RBD4_ANGAN